MDGLIALALAKKYADSVGQSIISAGFRVQVEQDRSILETTGEEKVLYLLPKEYGSSQDGYDEFVYANNTWEWVGKTDVDLNYELLSNKPQINNVELSGNKTLNDLGVQKKISFERPLFVAPTTNNYTVGDLFYYNQKIYKYQGASYDYLNNFSKMTYEVVGKKIYFITNQTPPEGENFPTKYVSTYRVGDIYVNQDNPPANIEGVLNGDIYICKNVLFNYNSSTKTVTYAYTWKTLPLNATTLAEYGITDAYTKTEVDAKLSALVSAVVNANGTITFTDSEGNSFTTSGSNLVTSGNEQVSMGYDEGGFYFLFDDGQEEVNNGTD